MKEKHTLFYRDPDDGTEKVGGTFSLYRKAVLAGQNTHGYGKFWVESERRITLLNVNSKARSAWQQFAPEPVQDLICAR